MGLLEYHALPSLLDADQDGVLCTFSNRLAPDPGQVVWSVRAGGMDRQSHPDGSLSSSRSQAGRRVGPVL
jgi:hypothetical protein